MKAPVVGTSPSRSPSTRSSGPSRATEKCSSGSRAAAGLTTAHGRPVIQDHAGPRAFAHPDQLAGLLPDELKRHGFSGTKARTIVETARVIVAGELDLGSLEQLDNAAAIERVPRRGVGRWTAGYVLLRGLDRLNIFPETTSARTTSSGASSTFDARLDYDGVKQLVARWHPVRGNGLRQPVARVAVRHLPRERRVRPRHRLAGWTGCRSEVRPAPARTLREQRWERARAGLVAPQRAAGPFARSTNTHELPIPARRQ
jgi:hypothetical protein